VWGEGFEVLARILRWDVCAVFSLFSSKVTSQQHDRPFGVCDRARVLADRRRIGDRRFGSVAAIICGRRPPSKGVAEAWDDGWAGWDVFREKFGVWGTGGGTGCLDGSFSTPNVGECSP
jgi:hypothetical protein